MAAVQEETGDGPYNIGRADQRNRLARAGPESPYSTAVKADGLIYLSGTLAEDAADGGGRDVGTETRLTLERMRDVLHASGSSLEHVVSVMVYLTAAEDFSR